MTMNAAIKLKPGLKTSLDNSRLTSVPKISTNTSSAASSSTKANKSSTTSTNTAKYNALQSLTSGNVTRTNFFSDGSYSAYKNRKEGMRNVSPSDYKMYNVGVNLDASIASGFAPTSRSARRTEYKIMTAYQKYFNMMNANTSSSNGAMSAMAVLNQLGDLAGNVTKTIMASNAAKSSNSEGAGVKNVSEAVGNVISDLSSASTSKEIEAGLASVDSQISSKTELSETLEGSIKLAIESKTIAESDLDQIKVDIEKTNESIRGIGVQLTNLESQLATAKSLNQNTSILESKIQGLKDQKADLENKLANLEKQKESKQNEIDSLEASIKREKELKEKTDSELSTLNQTKNQYSAKQTKLENSEQKSIRDLYGKITKIAKKIAKETDENKKNELIADYKELASKYNGLIDNTTANHSFEKVSEEPNIIEGTEQLLASGF